MASTRPGTKPVQGNWFLQPDAVLGFTAQRRELPAASAATTSYDSTRWPRRTILTEPSPRSYCTAQPHLFFFFFSSAAVALLSRNGSSGRFWSAALKFPGAVLFMFFIYLSYYLTAGQAGCLEPSTAAERPLPPSPDFGKSKRRLA